MNVELIKIEQGGKEMEVYRVTPIARMKLRLVKECKEFDEYSSSKLEKDKLILNGVDYEFDHECSALICETKLNNISKDNTRTYIYDKKSNQ
jgi:hypothetical protein